MKYSCFGCTRPEKGKYCHCTCEIYREEKRKDLKEKEEARRRKEIENGLIGQKLSGVLKAGKRRRF